MSEAKIKVSENAVRYTDSATKLEYVEVCNALATARICTNGAHVMSFVPAGQRDLLWMSRRSFMEPGKALTGGVPICWPWFGDSPNPARPKHGYARLCIWDLKTAEEQSDGSTKLVFTLDPRNATPGMKDFDFELSFTIIVGRTLEMILDTTNRADHPVELSQALHTYFAVSDIANVIVSGLDATKYLDTVPGIVPDNGVQHGDITVDLEFDRFFCPTESTVVLTDTGWGRKIKIEKSGSGATQVWNPWIAKAARMPNFGDEEYHEMICIEAVNARSDARILAPGAGHRITQKLTLM